MVKNKILLACLLHTILNTSFINASFVAMRDIDRITYIEQLKKKEVLELEKLLETDDDFENNKVSMILRELGNRADSSSKDVLERYSEKLAKEILKSSYFKQPYTYAQINLARIQAAGQNSEYIDKLEKLLISEDQYIQQDILAYELIDTLEPKARNILLKYENDPNIGTLCKYCRLRMDSFNLDDENFVKEILQSARNQIAKGNDTLVEIEILRSRMLENPFSSSLLEEEIKTPTIDREIYLEFLSESLERISNIEKTYYPWISELWDRFQQRESGLSDDLKMIFSDETKTKYSKMYREKAFEMYLTIQMEQSGFTNKTQDAAKYLLSQLTGTGDGHLSDYNENGVKTLQAIKNVVIVRLLSRYNNEVLPVINEEQVKESQSLRKEALKQIEKQIELTKR